MHRQPKIFVVEDDPAIVRLFELALQPLGLPISSFSTAEAFLDVVQPSDIGCLALDLSLPNMSGTELQQRLLARGIDLKVLVVSGTADVPSVVQAFRAGAVDVIQKPFSRADILQAVTRSLEGARADRNRDVLIKQASEAIARLTPRETEVFQMLCSGKANKQVAYDLGLSVRTVEVHRRRIMEKLAVESFAEALQLWLTASAAKP